MVTALSPYFLKERVGPRRWTAVIIGFLIIIYFDLSGFAAGVLLIQASMPSAVLNYLIAAIYSPKTITDSVASTIVVSTIMSFITLPIVIFISLKYFPL